MVRTFMAVALACALLAGCSGQAPRQEAKAAQVSGRLLERLDGPPYSFLRIETDHGQVWAAVPIGALATGAAVEVRNGVELRNYESKALGRRFDLVVFGTVGR